jgi:hypothetical protein
MFKLTRLAIALAGFAALAAAVPALGLAGNWVVNDHYSFTTDPFPTTFCGIDGTEVDTVVENLKVSEDSFMDNGHFTGLFTAAATGKTLELSASPTSKGKLTDNGDGTLTFSEQDTGLVLKFKIPNGPVLEDADGKPILGAGVLSTAITIDASTGDVISVEESSHGPHPLREGVDICGPAIAYLTS